MISAPTQQGGAVFSETSDGDLRSDPEARRDLADRLGISESWATLQQVHGRIVKRVDAPRSHGEGDALWTTVVGLPIAVFTADCLGVVVVAEGAVGVAHSGWRGAAQGVVPALVDEMSNAGYRPTGVAVGPGIGPCCFEVGPEVVGQIGHRAETSWGTTSVDLVGAVSSQVPIGVDVWAAEACTMHEGQWFSHRGDGTRSRMAALGWI